MSVNLAVPPSRGSRRQFAAIRQTNNGSVHGAHVLLRRQDLHKQIVLRRVRHWRIASKPSPWTPPLMRVQLTTGYAQEWTCCIPFLQRYAAAFDQDHHKSSALGRSGASSSLQAVSSFAHLTENNLLFFDSESVGIGSAATANPGIWYNKPDLAVTTQIRTTRKCTGLFVAFVSGWGLAEYLGSLTTRASTSLFLA